MKPAGFDYARPGSLDEALRLLAKNAGRGRLLAGGQSLGPMLNLRLATPELVIDIGRLRELQQVETEDGALVIGAGVSHADIEDGRVPDVTGGLLRRVAAGIAYRAVRNRGTIGGSLAHADPAADWPPVMIALGAELDVASIRGRRRIAAADFATGVLATVLEPDEMIEAIRIPGAANAPRWGHYKIAAKPGDFAESLAVVVIDRNGAGARAVLAGRSQVPIVLSETGRAIVSIRAWSSDQHATIAKGLDADFALHGVGAEFSPEDRAICLASVSRAAREAIAR
ncbi:MAG: FAD binding domain-containing protein [Stellaceae bacterium]